MDQQALIEALKSKKSDELRKQEQLVDAARKLADEMYSWLDGFANSIPDAKATRTETNLNGLKDGPGVKLDELRFIVPVSAKMSITLTITPKSASYSGHFAARAANGTGVEKHFHFLPDGRWGISDNSASPGEKATGLATLDADTFRDIVHELMVGPVR